MPYDPSSDTNQTNPQRTKEGVGARQIVVAPSDANDLTSYAKIIEVVAGGDVAYIPSRNDDADVIRVIGAAPGWRSSVNVRRVLATGTTATVVAVYD